MWSFRQNSKAEEKNARNIDVSKAIENPALKGAFQRHVKERTEASALAVGAALNSANYLIPIISDGLRETPNDPDIVTFEAGSSISFMNCQNEEGEIFLPAFTDWHEIRQWVKAKINVIVMPASELWQFALKDAYYKGIAINPATDAWTLFPANIQALIQDASNT